MKPRVLFVGRTRYRLPLEPGAMRKWEALGAELDLRVLGSAAAGAPTRDGSFRLVRHGPLDGPRFWAALPFRVARELRDFRPDAVVAQTAYETAAVLVARRLARVRPRVVAEVHADWRTSTRLYGSPARRALGPLGDRMAAWALRRAEAVRPVSPFTAGLVRELGVEPADSFPAYMDLEPFLATRPGPPRGEPSLLFVGVLERYKNVDGLVEAWRLAGPRVPGATLHVVGMGSQAELVRDVPGLNWTPRLDAGGVAAALDRSWALVLPSRSEGMGRVLVEAFCRGRAVVGTRAGSIPDLVEDGSTGLLVPPGDTAALADAMVRMLSEPELAARLGEAAHASAGPWLQTPEQYAARVRELVAP